MKVRHLKGTKTVPAGADTGTATVFDMVRTSIPAVPSQRVNKSGFVPVVHYKLDKHGCPPDPEEVVAALRHKNFDLVLTLNDLRLVLSTVKQRPAWTGLADVLDMLPLPLWEEKAKISQLKRWMRAITSGTRVTRATILRRNALELELWKICRSNTLTMKVLELYLTGKLAAHITVDSDQTA